MPSIADRLRALSTMGGQAAVSTLLQDAAAEIERLQTIVKALNRDLTAAQAMRARLTDHAPCDIDVEALRITHSFSNDPMIAQDFNAQALRVAAAVCDDPVTGEDAEPHDFRRFGEDEVD